MPISKSISVQVGENTVITTLTALNFAYEMTGKKDKALFDNITRFRGMLKNIRSGINYERN